MTRLAGEESLQIARSDLDHILTRIYKMCEAQEDTLRRYVSSGLEVAKV